MKLVIVMRKDLNMRKGKMCAQAGHASILAYEYAPLPLRQEWFTAGQTKVCVGVDSLEELMSLLRTAKEAGLPHRVVLDEGKTEFKGPTITCIAIGPDYSDEIDFVTGHLKLL